MAILKSKEIKLMEKSDREKKVIELRFELMKSIANTGKGDKSKAKEIKRTIARLLTIK